MSGHPARVPGDGFQLFVAFIGRHFLIKIAKQFRRRLDDAQRRAEFVRNHGNKIAFELAEFHFARQRPVQFRFRLLPLADVNHHAQQMVHAIEFDDNARRQHGGNTAAAIAQSAFHRPNRAGGPDCLPETLSLRRVFPDAQLIRAFAPGLHRGCSPANSRMRRSPAQTCRRSRGKWR